MFGSALCAITGATVLWLLRQYWKTWLHRLGVKVSMILQKSRGSFPEYTFSSSRPIIPGQVTTVEYDSSAGQTAGKQPRTAVTILREFHPAHITSPTTGYRHSSSGNQWPYGSSEVVYDEGLNFASGSARRDDSIHPFMSSSDEAQLESEQDDLVLSYPGGQIRGLEAMADFLKTRLTASPSDRNEASSMSDEVTSSISQALSGRRYKETRTPSLPRSHPHSRIGTRSQATSHTSRSRNRTPTPSDSSDHESSRSASLTRVDRGRQAATTHNYVRRVVRNTAFFQSTAQGEDFSGVPAALASHPELELGDLFYRRTGNKCQIWIWEREGTNRPGWRPVGWGYERQSDHKVLILSEKKALPSWVQMSHFVKHTQAHPDLRSMLVL